MFLSTQLSRDPATRRTRSRRAASSSFPVPYERTVSYGVGTRTVPAAILEASHYVELYDDELDEEVYSVGIHTLPAVAARATWSRRPASRGSSRSWRGASRSARRFVLTLGGEHSIATGPIRAHHARYPKLSILHFDAHGDLRDEYEGQKHSHACAARRFVRARRAQRPRRHPVDLQRRGRVRRGRRTC